MRGFPIGSFLFWMVDREHCHDYVFYDFITDYHERNARHLKRLQLTEKRDVTAILDGQQRLTALNIGFYGATPRSCRGSGSITLRPILFDIFILNISVPQQRTNSEWTTTFSFLPRRAEELNSSTAESITGFQ